MKENQLVYFISYLCGRDGDVYHYPLFGTVLTVYPEISGLSTSGKVKTLDGKELHVKAQYLFPDEETAKEKLFQILNQQKKEMIKKKENVQKEIDAISLFLSLSSPPPGETFKTTVRNCYWP